MEFLKQWTACICITLVVSVIFSLLTPKGRMQGFYKMVISLFIFMSFLYPFKSFDFKDFKISSSFNIEDVEDNNSKAVENMISTQIKTVLKKHNVNNASINVSVDYNGGEINVKDVTVAISDKYEIENVKTIIFDELGINAEVHYIGN